MEATVTIVIVYYINEHVNSKNANQILRDQYTNMPDGISGNEDCGQMSAWYVFGTLGLSCQDYRIYYRFSFSKINSY